jgi:hypothetical protein
VQKKQNLFFKMRDFQITGSDLIWVSNENLKNSLEWLKDKKMAKR